MFDIREDGQGTSSAKYVTTTDGRTIGRYSEGCFKKKRRIGIGSDGAVYQVYHCNYPNQYAAMKLFNMVDTKYTRGEVEFLLNHSHAHIINIIGLIESNCNTEDDERNEPTYSGYIMKYMEYGSLARVIRDPYKQYNLRLALVWVQQIASALHYLHKNGLFHRDLKPDNILLAAMDYIKLADFGSARSDIGEDVTSARGTGCYMAPEALFNKYGKEADIYSLGTIIWEIMHRRPPSEYRNTIELAHADLPLDPSRMSDEVYGLLKRCWKHEAKDRPLAQEIVEYFQSDIINFLTREACCLLIDLHAQIKKRIEMMRGVYSIRHNVNNLRRQFAFGLIGDLCTKFVGLMERKPKLLRFPPFKFLYRMNTFYSNGSAAAAVAFKELSNELTEDISSSGHLLKIAPEKLLNATML